MRKNDPWSRLLCGSIAGLAGTAVVMGMQEGGQKFMPRQMPPIRQNPGEYMVGRAEKMAPQLAEKVPESVEKAAAQVLGVGYGVAFAVIYAALRRRKVRHPYQDAGALGLSCWAAGYLGWLPATKLMPPITRQTPAQVIGAIATHLIYGAATVAAYRELRRH